MQVELIEKGGRVQSFTKEHANNLLKVKNTVWQLPTDSPFEFVNNVIKRKPNQGTDSDAPAKKRTRKSRKASE